LLNQKLDVAHAGDGGNLEGLAAAEMFHDIKRVAADGAG